MIERRCDNCRDLVNETDRVPLRIPSTVGKMQVEVVVTPEQANGEGKAGDLCPKCLQEAFTGALDRTQIQPHVDGALADARAKFEEERAALEARALARIAEAVEATKVATRKEVEAEANDALVLALTRNAELLRAQADERVRLAVADATAKETQRLTKALADAMVTAAASTDG